MHAAIRDGLLWPMGFDSWFDSLKALGLNSVEVWTGKPGLVDGAGWLGEGEQPFDLRDSAGRALLKQRFEEHGAIINAFAMANSFGAEDFDAEVDWLIATCRAAEEMGVPAIRIDVVPHGEVSEDAVIERSAEAIRSALAASSKVRLGMENHGTLSNRPDFIDKLLDRVGDRRMGLTLDTGNFYWYGHPLQTCYEIMERYADRVCHTHVKNISFPKELREVQREVGLKYHEYACPIYKGDIDHRRVADILKAAGYEWDFCIEDESILMQEMSDEDRKRELHENVKHLKACV